MDIRGPRLRKPSEEAQSFTSSMAFDGRIARQVIRVNMAHMAALVRTHEVDAITGRRCIAFLRSASPQIRPGTKAEDFHQQLEQDAVDALGVETAGYLNYGKSRNDQVATAVRMELRESIVGLIEAILELEESILAVVKKDGAVLLPGYTHLQRAQPVTLAHHFFAHFDAFGRDADRLLQLYRRVNLSPMGAAAMAGTSAKVDRSFVAESLGFDGLVGNATDAVSSRDFVVEAASCATIFMLDASRLAEELILWSTAEFGFVELDDAYSASSSIMPQKKNPVVAETARAKSGSVLGSLVSICTILKALPFSYNLDLQETTPHLWRSMDDSTETARVLAGAVLTLKVNKAATARALSGDSSTAVALANFLVAEHGVSFRQAHSIVGQLVRASVERGVPLYRVAATDLATVSRKYAKSVSIDERTAIKILDPSSFLGQISTEGGSNPQSIAPELEARRADLSRTSAEVTKLTKALKASDLKLNRIASGLAREVKKGS